MQRSLLLNYGLSWFSTGWLGGSEHLSTLLGTEFQCLPETFNTDFIKSLVDTLWQAYTVSFGIHGQNPSVKDSGEPIFRILNPHFGVILSFFMPYSRFQMLRQPQTLISAFSVERCHCFCLDFRSLSHRQETVLRIRAKVGFFL